MACKEIEVMKRLCLIALLLCSGAAGTQVPQSGTFNVTWTAPALEFTDGTAITGGTLYEYVIVIQGATGEGGIYYNEIDADPTATSASIPVYCGSYSVSILDVVMTPTEMYVSAPAGPLTYSTGINCPPDPTFMIPTVN
jgi:hypothetical protein